MEIRPRRLRSLTLLAVALSVLFLGVCMAAAALPPYGNHGRVLTAFPGGAARAAGIAGYGGGRMLVAGTASNGSDDDFVLARYLPSGRLDPGFGEGGSVRTDRGGNEVATDVKVDYYGRILVSGYRDSYGKQARDDEALVARYTAAGALDQSFGEGGVARAGRGGALALAVDRANHVLISGGTTLDPPHDTDNPWRLVRLNYDGALDTSFGGGDGEVTGALGAQSNVATDLTTDPDGRVVLAICGENAEVPPVFAVARLRADGSVDASFGSGGLTRVGFDDSWGCPRAVARDQRGRIVAAGNGNQRLVTARLRVDGSLDPSFGGDGTVSLLYRRSNLRLGRIAIDGHSRIVLAGRIAPTFEQVSRGARYPARMLLAKLRPDGRRDRRFGGDGDIAVRFGAGKTFDSEAADVTIYESAVYAAGAAIPHRSNGPLARFALSRYPAS